MNDYLEYLDRAQSKLPEIRGSGERFVVPEPKLLTKVERILTLRCDACGAHRPVTKRQASVIVKEDAIKEGESYDVTINAVGRKGDGIAKKDKYTIYVPGVKKGDIVKIKIKKITGNLAFAELIEKKAPT